MPLLSSAALLRLVDSMAIVLGQAYLAEGADPLRPSSSNNWSLAVSLASTDWLMYSVAIAQP